MNFGGEGYAEEVVKCYEVGKLFVHEEVCGGGCEAGSRAFTVQCSMLEYNQRLLDNMHTGFKA